MFFPRLFENISFSFYFFKNEMKFQKWSVFSKKIKLHKYFESRTWRKSAKHNIFRSFLQSICPKHRFEKWMGLLKNLWYSDNVKLKSLDQARKKPCFLRQYWIKGCRNINEMNQNKVSMKYLTAKFLQILNKKRQNLTFALPTGYLLSTLTILGIFLNFRSFLKP